MEYKYEKLSIVIPVYYNEGNLFPLYNDLKEKVLDKLDCDYEIVMVNDGSKDGSYGEMRVLAARDPNIVLVNLSRNFGEHAATLAGIAHSSGTVAVRKAADLQEPSEMILDMFEKYKSGAKVVIAVRKDREETFSAKFFSRVYCGMMRRFALSNMPRGGFDTFMISRQVMDILVSISEKNAPVTEEILWSGFAAEKVYYIRRKRKIGKSGWTLSKKIKLTVDSLVSFSYFPVRFITAVGGIAFMGSLIWAIVLLIQHFTGYITTEGFASLAIMIIMSFGIIMMTLGVLGEYIWRMFDETRNRPPYIVDEVIKNSLTDAGKQRNGADEC